MSCSKYLCYILKVILSDTCRTEYFLQYLSSLMYFVGTSNLDVQIYSAVKSSENYYIFHTAHTLVKIQPTRDWGTFCGHAE